MAAIDTQSLTEETFKDENERFLWDKTSVRKLKTNSVDFCSISPYSTVSSPINLARCIVAGVFPLFLQKSIYRSRFTGSGFSQAILIPNPRDKSCKKVAFWLFLGTNTHQTETLKSTKGKRFVDWWRGFLLSRWPPVPSMFRHIHIAVLVSHHSQNVLCYF